MPLHPQVQMLLDMMAFAGLPPTEEGTVEQAREVLMAGRELSGPPEAVARIEDLAVPSPAGEIPVRVYAPEGPGPLPALVYFHGGGFVTGSLETHDAPLRAIANRAGCFVASVDYRLAPEHKYPAAPEDCYAATRWVAENAGRLGVDPSRLAVGGDSAGGNLAAVVSLMARERGGPDIAYQLLLYPSTDSEASRSSWEENAEGYFLTRKACEWFMGHYVRGLEDLADPHVAPLLEPDLSGLPPGLVVTAEYDPLRDDGEAYAERLREAGVAVESRRYDGMIHGFLNFAGVLDVSAQLIEDVARSLREGLAA